MIARKLIKNYQKLPSPAASNGESASLNSNKACMSEDDDVRQEYLRISSSNNNDDVLRVQNLRKEFMKRSDTDEQASGWFQSSGNSMV